MAVNLSALSADGPLPPGRFLVLITNFIKIGSGSQTLMGGFTDTQTAWRSHKATSRKHAKTKSSWKNKSPTFRLCDTDRTENYISNNSSIIACVFVAEANFLPAVA
jgi:hypothetical protein